MGELIGTTLLATALTCFFVGAALVLFEMLKWLLRWVIGALIMFFDGGRG